MSLDNIQLPPIVIQELFKNSLVQLDTGHVKEPVPKDAAFNTLGNNQGHVLIIVDSKDSTYLPDEELNFLMGILSACKLTMDDVVILNISRNKNATYTALIKAFHPHTVILFAVKPEQVKLPFEIPQYKDHKYDKQTYLLAPSLSSIAANKEEKTKLWLCLKKMFSV